jgi:hypothetical protein
MVMWSGLAATYSYSQEIWPCSQLYTQRPMLIIQCFMWVMYILPLSTSSPCIFAIGSTRVKKDLINNKQEYPFIVRDMVASRVNITLKIRLKMYRHVSPPFALSILSLDKVALAFTWLASSFVKITHYTAYITSIKMCVYFLGSSHFWAPLYIGLVRKYLERSNTGIKKN